MIPSFRAAWLLVAVVLLLGIGSIPAVRWAMGVPELEPRQLAQLLAGTNPPLVLDLRNRENYLEGHIPGAIWVPIEGLEGYLSRKDLSPDRSLVICVEKHPFPAAGATAAAWHGGPVLEIAGGISGWVAALEKGEGEAVPPELLVRPTKEMSMFQQVVISILGLFIKPAYMLLCLALILILARTSSPPLRMLFWGLLLFDLGETFCTLDYFFCPSGFILIAPLDLVHGAGMVGLGCLGPWAIFSLVDDRLLRHADPQQTPSVGQPQQPQRVVPDTTSLPEPDAGHPVAVMPAAKFSGFCLMRRFCGNCMVSQKTRCGLLNLFLALVPALAIISLLPLSMPLRPLHYTSLVFQTFLECGFPILNEFVELWGYSVLGSLSFLTATFILWKGKPGFARKAEFPFFLGLGFASFALFRFFLHGVFRESFFWSNFWEEISESLAVCGIAWFLLIFRVPLGLPGEKVLPTAVIAPESRHS